MNNAGMVEGSLFHLSFHLAQSEFDRKMQRVGSGEPGLEEFQPAALIFSG